MSISQGSRRNYSQCMCSTMRSRIDDLKQQKLKKQQIYKEITSKFGKTTEIQKVLLKVFENLRYENFNIADIEKNISQTIEKAQKGQKKSNFSNKRFSEGSAEKILNEKTESPQKDSKKLSKIPENLIWDAVIADDTEKYMKEEQQRYKRNLENKEKLKKELDKQVKLKTEKFIEESKINKFYDDQQLLYAKTAKNRESKYEKDLQNKILFERKIIDDYVKENQKRKTAEFVKNQEYEKKLIKKIQDELKSEHFHRITQRNKEKNFYLNLIQENEAKKLEKLEKFQKEKNDDLVFMMDYTKMLDKQEKDRQEYLKRIENTFQRNTVPFAYETLRSQSKKLYQEEADLFQNTIFNEKIERNKEEKEMQQRKKIQEELKKTYREQIERKFQKMSIEKIKEKEIVEAWKKENQEIEKIEEEKRNKEKNIRYGHADYLRTQIIHKHINSANH